MAGRFPFDASRGSGQQQFNAASQMRAALGLPASIDPNEASLPLYLQAQAQAQAAQAQRQQSEQLQRDFHIRQALLQDQIDRHFSLERLRGLPSAFLEENPDLMDYKTELELRELEEQRQLEEQHQQRLSEQEYLRQQVAAAQLRYQDEVRRQQLTFHQEELAQQRVKAAQAQALAQAAHVQKAVQERAIAHQQQQQQQQAAQERAIVQQVAQERAKVELAAQQQRVKSKQVKSPAYAKTKPKTQVTKAALKGHAAAQALAKHASRVPGGALSTPVMSSQVQLSPQPMPSVKPSKSSPSPRSPPKQKAPVQTVTKPMKNKRLESKKRGMPPSIEQPVKRAATAKTKAALKANLKSRKSGLPTKTKSVLSRRSPGKSPFDGVTMPAGMKPPPFEIVRKGTVEGLLTAAAEDEKIDDAAGALCTFMEVEWSGSDIEQEEDGILLPKQTTVPAETIEVGQFKSALPSLPEEPSLDLIPATCDDSENKEETNGAAVLNGDKGKDYISPKPKAESSATKAAKGGKITSDQKAKKVSTILDYPCPIDTWWPSNSAVKAERRTPGESSDEDNFEDPPQLSEEVTVFRANEKKIRSRLVTDVEPGRLEKLNHCRIHRIRTKRKKNNTTPELVYCFQVTELYPNDIMVNCSICGTWRHAACGGHYKPYSTRENCQEAFVAVCENCHEEQPYLNEYTKGEQRLERQRMEQLRRGLATSAVMRNASYSKHSGTYKWPLGSVSATHIGGHTRSVHARQDKAERQWTDMAARLGRGDGTRPKDRVRVRTKELERLLVSIEDAESYTDRHNMLLFLLRDTGGQVPIGYENQPKNIFDPAEDNIPITSEIAEQQDAAVDNTNATSTSVIKEEEESEDPIGCARKGCTKRHRFDSIFCSDGCGILALEMDLLRSLQDASDVHPSVLRLT